jgi:tetratricopeptide (TPR) repeat protein
LVAAAAITVLGLNPTADQNKFRTRYRDEAEQALAAKHLPEAEVRFRRLAADANYPVDDVYGLAQTLEAEGNTRAADDLYTRLAPENATGHPAAHVRRALQLLAEKPPQMLRARGHLLHAINAQPDNAEAHALLGQMSMAAGDAKGAIAHFEIGVRTHPELSLPLAIAFKGWDEQASARWAAAAVAAFRPLVMEHPDDADARYRFALALRLAGRYPEAAVEIRADLTRANEPPFRPMAAAFRQLAGDVYGDWCASLTGADQATERLRLIEEGLAMNPQTSSLLRALVTAANGTGALAVQARASAERRMAAGGPAAVGLRLAFGYEAKQRGDIKEALRLFTEAQRADPTSTVAAIDLASILIQGPHANPGRALEVVDAALRNQPMQPNLRSVRGQTLVQLGRWQDAVRDLEYALPRLPPNRDIHQALAKAYRGLHLTSLAEAQDRRAKELPK